MQQHSADNPTDALKRRVGRQPFEARAQFTGDFCACPFHTGDSPKSMHLHQVDGIWLAHCFSECKKSWDAIAFVMDKDKVDFANACKRLEGLPPDTRPVKLKRTPVAMTAAQWSKWGRSIEQADVDKFAAARPHSHTATLDYFRALGVRVKDDYLGFPYRRNGEFSGVKMRKLGNDPRAIPQMAASLWISPKRVEKRWSVLRPGVWPAWASRIEVKAVRGPNAPKEFSRMTTQVPATPACKQ